MYTLYVTTSTRSIILYEVRVAITYAFSMHYVLHRHTQLIYHSIQDLRVSQTFELA